MAHLSILVDASHARRSNYAPDEGRLAVDVDVKLTISVDDALTVYDGGVTLIEDHEGRLSSWGQLENWLSGNLVNAVWTLDESMRRDVLDRIERAARLVAREEVS